MIRIGHGYDVHAFGDGDHVVLGGVNIPYERGVIAHSDGDVALHALCDGLLGAAGLGDIGQHFPDSDARYKGIDSLQLLRITCEKIQQAGFVFGNADITIVAQQPRVQAHKQMMQKNIAKAMECAEGQINIKATTTEQLGFLGRSEGLAAHAVVLINAAT